MNRCIIAPALITALSIFCSPPQMAAPQQGNKITDVNKPGWIGLFPKLDGFVSFLSPPTVGGGKENPSYSQMVTHYSIGQRVTVARDFDFKEKYSEAAVMKSKPFPERMEVSKHPAWLWKLEPDGSGRPWTRLVILLSDDRILMVEHWGHHPNNQKDAEELVRSFDLAKIKAALDHPPFTGSRRSAEAFCYLQKSMSYSDVKSWIGPADKDIGSGIHIMVYALDDGSEVLLGFPDFNNLIYVKHNTKDGKTVDLVK